MLKVKNNAYNRLNIDLELKNERIILQRYFVSVFISCFLFCFFIVFFASFLSRFFLAFLSLLLLSISHHSLLAQADAQHLT
jgi:hypothetical protein